MGIYELGWQVGGLVGFWINYGVSTTMAPTHEQWIIPFALQLIPAGLMFIGMFFVPESPRWLLANVSIRSSALNEALRLISSNRATVNKLLQICHGSENFL